MRPKRPRLQSGQYILKRIIQRIDKLRQRNVTITIRWIPAHVGVQDNEEVDKLAKQAAGHKSQPGERVGLIYRLKATIKRDLRKECLDQWKDQWHMETTGRLYKRQFGSTLDRHISKLYNELPKALSSILIQMRTNKIGLAKYLHSINRAEEPGCTCKTANQTVSHIIEECPYYRVQRTRHFNQPVLRDIKTILSDPRTAAKAAHFMLDTGLLDQFRHFKTAIQKQLMESE